MQCKQATELKEGDVIFTRDLKSKVPVSSVVYQSETPTSAATVTVKWLDESELTRFMVYGELELVALADDETIKLNAKLASM